MVWHITLAQIDYFKSNVYLRQWSMIFSEDDQPQVTQSSAETGRSAPLFDTAAQAS